MNSRIKEQLDRSLEIATTAKEINAMCVMADPIDVLISGLPGSGKTSFVKEWAEERGVLLVPYDLKRSAETVHEKDQFGILHRKNVENPVDMAKQLIFAALSKYKDGENFILLLDDYHLATKENIAAMNYTIDTHKIINPVTKEVIKLKNLLFVIATQTTC